MILMTFTNDSLIILKVVSLVKIPQLCRFQCRHIDDTRSWRHYVFLIVSPSRACDHNISRTPSKNVFQFGTNSHLELRMT